ncbi:hypothetical protein [Rosenbergiella nectarea]|uniref:hypothetical protein n=1 Tax=Rosenbergiella nectarea TaxID=988801 RepID=UPI001BD95936|nr:hypothetical protein [Rosenbergiella nectarea]MBT0731140.1 hypothetical protein [Rosenbergiella nectarea subsp. apis]
MIFFNKEFEINILSKVTKLPSIPNEISKLIDDGFIIHSDGCIFFKEKQPIDTGSDNESFFDKTEQECFYNELRVSDYIEDDIVSVAVNVSEMIAEKLHETIPSKSFEIVTSFDNFDGEIDAVIKLHTLRKEEAPYIDIQSIDEYQQPLFICRTG